MQKLHTTSHKAALLQHRSKLLEQLHTLRGGEVGRAQASAEHFHDREDSTASANTARDLELALDAHDSAEIAAIDAALKRMDEGSYGDCVDCGAPIAEARLRAAPEASRCLDCQEKLERQQRA